MNETKKYNLLLEFGRLIEECAPSIISMENVPRIRETAVFQQFIEILDQNGYHHYERSVLSCHFLTRINKDKRIHMEGIVRNMMNDKQQYDYAKLNKDLSDRQQIIDEFNRTRYLDRSKAISLIQSLRREDADVMTATTAAHAAAGVTTWDKATNEQVVGELILQVNVLQAKITIVAIQNGLG